MKAISIRQPWASLIVFGPKTIETRNWSTGYRGPLLINAAKAMDGHAYKQFQVEHPTLLIAMPMERGAMIGVCELYACRKCKPVDEVAAMCWCRGRYGLFLRNKRPLEKPIPYRGQLSLFDVAIEETHVRVGEPVAKKHPPGLPAVPLRGGWPDAVASFEGFTE